MNTVSLRERVLSAAAATPSLTRRRSRLIAALLASLSAALAAALFVAAGGPAHLRDPTLSTVMIARGWALAAGAFACLVLSRGRSTVVRMPRLLTAATWASPVLMLLWVLRFDTGPPSFPEATRGCLLGLAVAATPLASFLALRRGSEPRHPHVLGAAAGAMFAACGQVVVLLCHPFTGFAYAAGVHVLPLLALTGVGRLAGGRLLATAGARRWGWDDPSRDLVRNQPRAPAWSNWEDFES